MRAVHNHFHVNSFKCFSEIYRVIYHWGLGFALGVIYIMATVHNKPYIANFVRNCWTYAGESGPYDCSCMP